MKRSQHNHISGGGSGILAMLRLAKLLGIVHLKSSAAAKVQGRGHLPVGPE